MDFMSWAVEVASEHPELATGAIVTRDGDWLDVLLLSGETFRFRPGALINEDASEPVRRNVLNRLISIAVSDAKSAATSEAAPSPAATPAEPTLPAPTAQESDPSHNPQTEPSQEPQSEPMHRHDAATDSNAVSELVPIVRGAHFFLSPQYESSDDPGIYRALSDFVAMGLGTKSDATTLGFATLPEPTEVAPLAAYFSIAVSNLRELTAQTAKTVDLSTIDVAGAQVLQFLQPQGLELAWFADVEMLLKIREQLEAEHPESIALFVPASTTKLYVVFSEDPHLSDFFRMLLEQRNNPDAVYPLPHTLTTDGWREWIPLGGSELSQTLGALRNVFRQRCYDYQGEHVPKWLAHESGLPDSPQNAPIMSRFEPRVTQDGERVSNTTWRSTDQYGSIPETDYITFVREGSPHPWEDQRPTVVTVRTTVAHELWPEGFAFDSLAWPPRLTVKGFPDDATLLALAQATSRII